MYIPEDYNVFEPDPDYECDRRIEQIGHIYEEFGLNYDGEYMGRPVYYNEKGYFRIDRVTMPDGPYALLEWKAKEDDFYEDSGYVRYDDHPDGVYNEICCILGYPYSMSIRYKEPNYYMGKKVPDAISEPFSGRQILHMSENYILYGEYEDTFLYNINTGNKVYLGGHYGDPDMGIIDKNEEFCAVYGEHLVIYYIKSAITMTVNTPIEWGYYMRQVNDDCFEIRFQNNPMYVINVKNVRDGESIEEHKP